MTLRTRYRIVFLYREKEDGKCVNTPLFYKLSGAVDGDAFKEYKALSQEIYDMIEADCIIKEKSGVCIVLYNVKEPFKGVKYTPQTFVYKAKVRYEFTTTKTGVKRAYKVNTTTGKKVQTDYKKARKNNNSQNSRVRKSRKAFTISELDRHKAFDNKQAQKKEAHRAQKKQVLKQFEMFKGCYSPDMAYKGR